MGNQVKLSNEMHDVKLEFESIKDEIAIYPEFDIESTYQKIQSVKKKYKSVLKNDVPDFFTSKKIQNRAQNIINQKLGIKE